MMNENERAYCRVCGEGCGPEVSFCVDWGEQGGVVTLDSPEPKSFWTALLRRLLRALRLRR